MTHRPELHVTPGTGVLRAPAAALFDGTIWHVFHQFQPRTTEGSRWAHQYSDGSPFSFEECDDVLAPEGDELEIRAGSVTATDNEVNLYFTSVTETGRSIHLAEVPDIAATVENVNDDPTALDPHVRRVGEILGDINGGRWFRSPCVVPDWRDHTDRDCGHSGWIMLAVQGHRDAPEVVVCTSPDGVHWSLLGPLELVGDTGLQGERMVAPRIIRLHDEVKDKVCDVLLITLERDGIDASGYLIGSLVGTQFRVDKPFRRIDHGHDFTRPRNTNFVSRSNNIATHYRDAYLFGLMNGVGRLDDAYQHESYLAEGWANCLSLPRRVTLQDGILYQTPARGLISAIEESDHALMLTSIFEVPPGDAITVELTDSCGQVAATITHYGDRLELDRSMNTYHQGDEVAVAPLGEGDTDTITVIADGSTVEVFADGGQVAMASRVYFNGQCEEFHLHHTPGVTVLHTNVIAPTMSGFYHLDDVDEGIIR